MLKKLQAWYHAAQGSLLTLRTSRPHRAGVLYLEADTLIRPRRQCSGDLFRRPKSPENYQDNMQVPLSWTDVGVRDRILPLWKRRRFNFCMILLFPLTFTMPKAVSESGPMRVAHYHIAALQVQSRMCQIRRCSIYDMRIRMGRNLVFD